MTIRLCHMPGSAANDRSGQLESGAIRGVGMWADTAGDGVSPLPGSILHCPLWGVEHSGVYLGGQRIVDLSGRGDIREIDPAVFVRKCRTPTIYVACAGGVPLHSPLIARRAQRAVGTKRRYRLLSDNCHRFTASCVTGDPDVDCCRFHALEDVVGEVLNDGAPVDWLVWKSAVTALDRVPKFALGTLVAAWMPGTSPGMTPNVNALILLHPISSQTLRLSSARCRNRERRCIWRRIGVVVRWCRRGCRRPSNGQAMAGDTVSTSFPTI